MKWKLKLKGSGTPPDASQITGGSGGSQSFNAPHGQMKGQGNNRMSGYPPGHSGPSPKKRTSFPRPKSFKRYGSPRGTNPAGPGG